MVYSIFPCPEQSLSKYSRHGCYKMRLKEKSIGLDECVDLGDKGIKVIKQNLRVSVA